MVKVLGTFIVTTKKKVFAAVEYKAGDMTFGRIVFSERPMEGSIDMLSGTDADPGTYYLKVQENTVGDGIKRHTFFFDEARADGELARFITVDPLCFGPCPPYLLQCSQGTPSCGDGFIMTCE